MSRPNVVVVSAQCSLGRGAMGIRIEEVFRRKWVANWSFRLSLQQAKREGFDGQKFEVALRSEMTSHCVRTVRILAYSNATAAGSVVGMVLR